MFKVYMISIHILLVILIFKTDTFLLLKEMFRIKPINIESTEFYQKSILYHQRQLLSLSESTSVFFGDSMIHGLNASLIESNTLNFGIGGDTSEALFSRLPRYFNIKKAKNIFFHIGINDIGYESVLKINQNIENIMVSVNKKEQVWLAIIPPTQNYAMKNAKIKLEIDEVNLHTEDLCNNQQHCTYIPAPQKMLLDSGYLKEVLSTDGLHLSARGYDLWAKTISKKIDFE